MAIRTDPVNHYPNLPDYNPLITLGSTTSARVTRVVDTSGGISLGSTTEVRRSFNYASTGVIEVGGNAGTRYPLNINLDIPWRLRSRISLDRSLVWDTGKQRQYWYRILGKQKRNVCPPIGGDDCCSYFVVNVHAQTIADLCAKLKKQNFIWPIERVDRFTRPAEMTAINEDAAKGIFYDCNELEPVEICSIPICQEFCIDADVIISMGMSAAPLYINAEFTGETEWDLPPGESSIGISGYAIVTSSARRYEVEYVSGDDNTDNALFSIGGSADVSASDYAYESTGGFTIGGNSSLRAKDWDFIGGEWIDLHYGQPTTTSLIDATPLGPEAVVSWLLPENVAVNDGNSSIVDLSWFCSSNYLVARGFNFDIQTSVEIRSIEINIKKFAAGQVKDLELYLVNGNEIISVNFANTLDAWNNSSAVETYRISDEDFVGLGGFLQEGGWTVGDINDPEFGVAIRAVGNSNSSGVLACVDYVDLTLYCEDAFGQILRVGGAADVRSSAWHYTSQGGFSVEGETAENKKTLKPSTDGGVKLGGGCRFDFFYVADGQIEFGGEAIIQPIVASGGCVLGGEFGVGSTHTSYVASGGLELSYGEGNPIRTADFVYVSEGGFTIGNSDPSALQHFAYESSGGLELDGNIDMISSTWHWQSEGNGISVGGGTESQPSNFEVSDEFNCDMSVVELKMVFGSDVETNPLKISSDVINVCGCTDISVALNLSHNLVNHNKLSQFLARNNLSMASNLKLHYNKVNALWQSNLHFKGLSADLDTYEIWNIVFDIRCTSFIGGTEIDQEVLAFSVRVTQKNLTSAEDFETRLILGFVPDQSCIGGSFNTKLIYDTQSEVAIVKPNAQIYYYNLYDDLDLFKNAYWGRNPNLQIQLSNTNLEIPQYRQNLDVVLSK